MHGLTPWFNKIVVLRLGYRYKCWLIIIYVKHFNWAALPVPALTHLSWWPGAATAWESVDGLQNLSQVQKRWRRGVTSTGSGDRVPTPSGKSWNCVCKISFRDLESSGNLTARSWKSCNLLSSDTGDDCLHVPANNGEPTGMLLRPSPNFSSPIFRVGRTMAVDDQYKIRFSIARFGLCSSTSEVTTLWRYSNLFYYYYYMLQNSKGPLNGP